jgi:hypothetical protein
MIVEYKRKGWVLVIGGFLLFFGGLCLAIILPNFVLAYSQVHHGARPQWIVFMEWLTPQRLGNVGLLACVLFIIGHGFLAKSKGYSSLFGILGFLPGVGLLILLVLPDRT